MRKLKRFFAQEDGIAMATVVMMTAVLTILSVVLIDQVRAESNRAAKAVSSDSVFQAAEAGINDYIAKLTEDPQFYDHYVAKGESTRLGSDGATVSHSTSTTSSIWPADVTWTYPNGKNWWSAGIGNSAGNSTALRGYAYNLMITPPSGALGPDGTNYITIVSTGCKVIDPNATPVQCVDSNVAPKRAIEVRVRRTTPADFQYMIPDMNDWDVCWASNIYGRMYSVGYIKVCGATSHGNLMAEDLVTGSPLTLVDGARVYDDNHPDIRDVIRNPIPFSSLSLASLDDNKRAAAMNTPSTDFEDTNASAWRVNFSSDGTFQAWKCVSSQPSESSQPYCGPDVTLTNNTTLPRTGTINFNVTGNPEAFLTTGGTIYVGPSSAGRTDTVNYTSRTGNTLNQATCTSCGSSSRTHQTNEIVSMVPGGGGITWAVPWYDGPIPSNGAIYTGQDAIISWPSAITGYSSDGSSTFNGRVTLASAGDVVVAGNVHYASESAPAGIGGPDDDVLGLIARNNIWMAKYAPNNLWWRAATIASTGLWGDYRCRNGGYRGDSSSMTFVGSSAYNDGSGCIRGSGGFNIDHTYRITDDGSATSCPDTAPNCTSFDALKFLFPPWFPVINGMETTVLFREVPPSYVPDPVPAG